MTLLAFSALLLLGPLQGEPQAAPRQTAQPPRRATAVNNLTQVNIPTVPTFFEGF